jgi:hypothetical protein
MPFDHRTDFGRNRRHRDVQAGCAGIAPAILSGRTQTSRLPERLKQLKIERLPSAIPPAIPSIGSANDLGALFCPVQPTP